MSSHLHIRCGDDLRPLLKEANVDGDFLAFTDPVCQGPVPDELDDSMFRDRRADYVSAAYGADRQAVLGRMEDEDRALSEVSSYDNITLWFEHDIYDQAILIRLLARLRALDVPPSKLNMVTLNAHPNHPRFIGLGQLSPTEIASLSAQPIPVTHGMMELGAQAWAAFRAETPVPLLDIGRNPASPLPFLPGALKRYFQEYPWIRDGLGLTQRLALQAVNDGARTPGNVFRVLNQETDPQPYHGDMMFKPVLRSLIDAAHPALAIDGGSEFWDRPLEITATGRTLLDEADDWVELNGIDQWHGGVHLHGAEAAWRWDEDAETVMASGN